MRRNARSTTAALLVALALAGAHDANALQAQPAPAKPPEPAPAKPRDDAKPAPPRSLDDLLGIPRTAPAQQSEKPAEQQTPPDIAGQAQRDLERALRGESLGDMFQEAVKLMRDTASRIDARQDIGATTQRMQEEILARLDAVIARAEQQSSQSQQQQQQSGQSREQQRQPGQQQRQQGAEANQPQQGDAADNASASARQDAQQARGWIESATPTWGRLPVRLRDALLQGAGDTFSSMYERMTEDYYRRLAEERPTP